MTAIDTRTQQPVQGLPLWYLVLAGLLVASYDMSLEFPEESMWRTALPLGIAGVHMVLWLGVLRRRMRYTRAVLRSPKARLLVIALGVVRFALVGLLSRLYTGAHEHLVAGAIMLVAVPVIIYVNQRLILRTLRREES